MAAEPLGMDEVEIRAFGKYLVSDPRICHGHWTIRGIRILVSVILEEVAEGDDWDTIVGNWDGKVSKDAIRKAVLAARDTLLATSGETRAAAGLGLLAPG